MPELIAIMSKVVTKARTSVEKKRGSADDNGMKVSDHLMAQFHELT